MGKSIPSTVPKTADLALGTLTVVVDLFQKATGKQVFYCNNCGRRLILDAETGPQRVCRKCGEEFDWDGLKVTKVNVCPTCNKEYEADDVYCEDHAPAVKLKKRYQ